MNNSDPALVDAYLESNLLPEDVTLRNVLQHCNQEGLPEHSVSPLQGQFLQIIAKAIGARRILEIGTLGGYSSIWLARALPDDGKLVTLELDLTYSAVAAENFQEAGVNGKITQMVGPAIESLDALISANTPPFDLIFIDADKVNDFAYLEASLALSRIGTVIIGDNVIRDGSVADHASTDPKTLGVRKFLNATGQNKYLLATALQTVGIKGHDGFSMALVIE
jgi:predicted O-methyltransferase YrrM